MCNLKICIFAKFTLATIDYIHRLILQNYTENTNVAAAILLLVRQEIRFCVGRDLHFRFRAKDTLRFLWFASTVVQQCIKSRNHLHHCVWLSLINSLRLPSASTIFRLLSLE